MNSTEVMQELESLATTHTRKRYVSNGAVEPLFGVATGKMKPMSKVIGTDQELAEELYATNNFDAMYFAGVIAEPNKMTEEDYDRWIDAAYFHMLSDNVVAVTLSEADIAQVVADKWIKSDEELRKSGGWSTYCWLLGSRKDEEFSEEKIADMLDYVKNNIHNEPPHAQEAMNNFVYTVGTSFKPLHEKAVEIGTEIGTVIMERGKKKPKELNAYASIQKEIERDRIGFKRRYVRC